MLADGNRITQQNETRIYRDGQGRTRREQTLGGLGVWQPTNEPATTITIHDPVAGTTFMLSPGTETAHEIQSFRLATAQFRAHAGLEGSSVEVSGPGSVAPAPVPALGGGAAGVRVEARNVVIEADGGPHVETFELPVPPPETGVAGVGAFPPTAAVVVSVAHPPAHSTTAGAPPVPPRPAAVPRTQPTGGAHATTNAGQPQPPPPPPPPPPTATSTSQIYTDPWR